MVRELDAPADEVDVEVSEFAVPRLAHAVHAEALDGDVLHRAVAQVADSERVGYEADFVAGVGGVFVELEIEVAECLAF